MIYQVHFPTMNPSEVMMFTAMLLKKGYSWGGNPLLGSFSYYVDYVCVYQDSRLYTGKSGEPYQYCERTIEWDDDLSCQLKLVPEEAWEDYIVGHKQ